MRLTTSSIMSSLNLPRASLWPGSSTLSGWPCSDPAEVDCKRKPQEPDQVATRYKWLWKNLPKVSIWRLLYIVRIEYFSSFIGFHLKAYQIDIPLPRLQTISMASGASFRQSCSSTFITIKWKLVLMPKCSTTETRMAEWYIWKEFSNVNSRVALSDINNDGRVAAKCNVIGWKPSSYRSISVPYSIRRELSQVYCGKYQGIEFQYKNADTKGCIIDGHQTKNHDLKQKRWPSHHHLLDNCLPRLLLEAILLRLELELFLEPDNRDLDLAGAGGVPILNWKSGSSGSKLPKTVNSSSSTSDPGESPTEKVTNDILLVIWNGVCRLIKSWMLFHVPPLLRQSALPVLLSFDQLLTLFSLGSIWSGAPRFRLPPQRWFSFTTDPSRQRTSSIFDPGQCYWPAAIGEGPEKLPKIRIVVGYVCTSLTGHLRQIYLKLLAISVSKRCL